MSLRIPWDKYEAAYLLLSCIDVINNRISRSEAIKKVSKTLRRRAILNGLKIDSMYRNENGISFQLEIMISLYLHKKTGLHGASKLFVDTVDLYEENPERIEELVKDQMEREIRLNINDRDQSHKWLSSSLYLGDSNNIKRICNNVKNEATESIKEHDEKKQIH